MEEFITGRGEDFPRLWQRICSAAAQPAANDEQLYSEFINEAYCSALFYTNLSKMFPNPGRSLLLAHAQDCKNRCRILRAEFFISTGLSIQPEGHCGSIAGKNAALRSAVLQSQRQAERYARCAEVCRSPALQRLCTEYAEQCMRQSLEDRELLLECF